LAIQLHVFNKLGVQTVFIRL